MSIALHNFTSSVLTDVDLFIAIFEERISLLSFTQVDTMGARIKELEDEVSVDLSAFLRKGNLIYSHSIYWNPEAGFLLTRTYRPML